MPIPTSCRHVLAAALSAGCLACADTGGEIVSTAQEGTRPLTALGAGITEHILFNDPYTAPDDTITMRIRGLIENTPAYDTIRAAIYNINDTTISEPLRRAHQRNVRVYVVHSGDDGGQIGQALATLLGSRYVRCGSTTSTVKACNSSRSSSSMHAKFYLFSNTSDGAAARTKVVAVTSANPTTQQYGLYNNLVIVAGDPEAYTGFRKVFDDMRIVPFDTTDYRHTPNGYFRALNANLTAYFSPMPDSNGDMGEEASTDQVALTMQKMNGGTGCYAYAAQANFTNAREPIVDELIRIDSLLGCTVRVAYTEIGDTVKARLLAGGVSLRRVQNPDIHHKYYLMYGNYTDNEGVYRLFTGSHNWTGPALRRNDEVLLKLWEPARVQDFVTNFNLIWGRGVAQGPRPQEPGINGWRARLSALMPPAGR